MGGVLEHPAQSRAWRRFDLPRPAFMHWQRGICGGWCIEFDQRLFGHPARKLTWLYAFGGLPPTLPKAELQPTTKTVRVYRVRNDDGTWSRRDANGTQEITHAAAEHTPPTLAQWLVELARRTRVAGSEG
jgi:hypothetical protein